MLSAPTARPPSRIGAATSDSSHTTPARDAGCRGTARVTCGITTGRPFCSTWSMMLPPACTWPVSRARRRGAFGHREIALPRPFAGHDDNRPLDADGALGRERLQRLTQRRLQVWPFGQRLTDVANDRQFARFLVSCARLRFGPVSGYRRLQHGARCLRLQATFPSLPFGLDSGKQARKRVIRPGRDPRPAGRGVRMAHRCGDQRVTRTRLSLLAPASLWPPLAAARGPFAGASDSHKDVDTNVQSYSSVVSQKYHQKR